MNIERAAAACLFPGFAGLSAPEWVRSWVERGLGGVVLFSRNIESTGQVRDLTASLRAERDDVLVATDEEGGDVLATAKRELAEEIGKAANSWVHLTTFYASPGFSDEQIHVYLATDLYDEQAHTDEIERIEIVKVPLGEIDDVIAANRDSKTLVGLLWFRAFGGAAG